MKQIIWVLEKSKEPLHKNAIRKCPVDGNNQQLMKNMAVERGYRPPDKDNEIELETNRTGRAKNQAN